MKKQNAKLLLTAVISLAAFTANALEATVVSTSGKVEVQKGDVWVALSAGDSVRTGDLISTGFKSEATIKVSDSVFTLGPLTRITVEKFVATQSMDDTSLFIDSGSITADVSHTGERRVGFKVSSPVATASVRGTSFYVNAAGRIETTQGLVSKEPPTSSSAQVTNETDIAALENAFVPENEKSTPATPTIAIGGNYGVPVFAGQASTTDPISLNSTNPQEQAARETRSLENGTASQASHEHINAPGAPHEPGAIHAAGSPTPSQDASEASLVLGITLND